MRKSHHIYIYRDKCRSSDKRPTASIINLLSRPVCKSSATFSPEVARETTKEEIDITHINVSHYNNKSNKYFSVVWGKSSTRKHKTFEEDGTLDVTDGFLKLLNEKGTVVATARNSFSKDFNFLPGVRLNVSNKDVEIIEEIQRNVPDRSKESSQPSLTNFSGKHWNSRLVKKFSGEHKKLIFPKPDNEHQWINNHQKSTIKEVVLDSFLEKALRPHQKDGVIFLYECVMGCRNPGYYGAILADEMGLGKTLQCVALIWTLLKQGPYIREVCKKVIVITPSSLCDNWGKEFTKWLGGARIETYIVSKTRKASEFQKYPLIPIMIISYEQFVRSIEDVRNIKFDLIICDEGHRLKNSSVKAAQMLYSMDCKRRILLTGTPIQNNLEEYFSLVNIVIPGFLGSYSDFRKNYEQRILAAQEVNCSEEVKTMAEEKSAELNKLTSKFLLKRTQAIMVNYLPTREDYILCVKLQPIQKQLYEEIITEWFQFQDKNAFSVIAKLKKICSHPLLITDDLHGKKNFDILQDSGKFIIIQEILLDIYSRNANIVLVSYSTKILDLLEKLCKDNKLTFLRLDGSTPVTKRKSLVDMFNNCMANVFLLSARAGGTGLNLTGASTLILVDGDWNPSNDLQAIARIWRDGQRKNVKTYRLISTGTIEEKIFQRQLSKLNLRDAVDDPDNVNSVLKFSELELKDIFTPNFETISLTHDLMQCSCLNEVSETPTENTYNSIVNSYTNELKEWDHYCAPFQNEFVKSIGLEDSNNISFMFRRIAYQESS